MFGYSSYGINDLELYDKFVQLSWKLKVYDWYVQVMNLRTSIVLTFVQMLLFNGICDNLVIYTLLNDIWLRNVS